MWTLSSLQLHPHPMIVVDEDATLELQVKTVKVYHSSPSKTKNPLQITLLTSDSISNPSKKSQLRKVSSKSSPLLPALALARKT